MAKVNNPVIGKVDCYNMGCTEKVTVHQIQKGSREGELYTRCPECKCNQSTGRPFQSYLLNKTDFYDDYKSLSTNNKTAETEPDEKMETETREAGKTEKTQDKKTFSGLIFGTLVAIGLIALGAGK